MAVAKAAPEDRRYYIRLFGRAELEVTEDQYQQAIKVALGFSSIAEGPSHLTFNTAVLDGWFVDPMKEEVLANGDRT